MPSLPQTPAGNDDGRHDRPDCGSAPAAGLNFTISLWLCATGAAQQHFELDSRFSEAPTRGVELNSRRQVGRSSPSHAAAALCIESRQFASFIRRRFMPSFIAGFRR